MREKVMKILGESCAEIDFTASSQLVTDGILDSISLVEIITGLDTELGVEIPFEEITPENFNSIDSIVELVEKYL